MQTEHSESKKRLDYIDVAKGILIILVVVAHVLTGSVFITKTLIRIINSFHMPAFFIVSGLLTSEIGSTAQGFFPFIKKKLCVFWLHM